ncbi:MAG: hypothetical protein QW083_00535 [Methanomassiliicoccales archaeon]
MDYFICELIRRALLLKFFTGTLLVLFTPRRISALSIENVSV